MNVRFKVPVNGIVYMSNFAYKLRKIVVPYRPNNLTYPINANATFSITPFGEGPFILGMYDT